jgi:diguanylate cyclase (GGDEF)-like protein
MHRLATTDGLTGVRNKQFLLEESETFITRSPHVCLLMIDIDHFEIINAMQGYVVGDHILFHVGNLMNQFFSDKNAIASRFVGKRFAVLLGECPLDRGKSIAEEFRQQIMQLKPDGVDITISIGLTAGDNRSNLESMLTEADSALHNAQIQGYNRTSLSITCKDDSLT